MEQCVLLECYHCRILYPGTPRCGVCGGSGMRTQSARMADESLSREILEGALRRLGPRSDRSDWLHAVILWQIYGSAYVRITKGLEPGTPEHQAELRCILEPLVRHLRG